MQELKQLASTLCEVDAIREDITSLHKIGTKPLSEQTPEVLTEINNFLTT